MRAGDRGFTLIAMLVLLATSMLGLAIIGPVWSRQTQRDREQELLRIGSLYAEAIADYRAMSPGGLKQYPAKLEDLLLDQRFVGTRRPLRRLYGDPMNPGQPWGLVRDDQERIMGVYSQSHAVPLARAVISTGRLRLAPAQRYADWKFVIELKS